MWTKKNTPTKECIDKNVRQKMVWTKIEEAKKLTDEKV